MSNLERDGWLEATIAWSVCASLHREYCKRKDPLYTMRQGDFTKHENAARATLAKIDCPCHREEVMPTAPDDLRELMITWFGDIDAMPPLRFLESRGYRRVSGGVIVKPCLAHTVSPEEDCCIDFLFMEWDFGFNPERV